GNHQRQVSGRNQEGQNQYDVLCNLSVGNTFHAAQYRVEEYYYRGDQQTPGVGHFQEAGKSNTGTSHLTNYVGQGDDDQTYNRNHTGSFTVVTLTNEVRHGVGTETAQVRSQQGCQQYIATSPSHD